MFTAPQNKYAYVYDIDRIYKSMTGPWSNREVHLVEADQPELVWITGCHVEMVGPDGATHDNRP